MQSRIIEIWVGLFVLIGLAALLMLAMKVSNLGAALATDSGYPVIARFENIGGLKEKSSVKMGGVRIGRISEIRYDDNTYEAVVTMLIDNQYQKIPMDSSAAIYTSGLLGEQYVGLEAGASMEYLSDQPGSELMITQSAVILEQLIGKFLYGMASGDSGN